MEGRVEILAAPPAKDPRETLETLREVVNGLDVVRAYVFGSYARGHADRWSDLDVVIVAPTKLPFVERFREFLPVLHVHPAVELIVYTPEEFESMKQAENPLILDVLENGVVICEK